MLSLLAAAKEGDAKKVDELLAQLPQECLKHDYRKRTPLHLAVEHGHGEVVDVLIAHADCIDPDAADCAGFTALHLAAEFGHEKIVTRLIEMSWLTDAKAYNGLTCLHLAAINGHVAIVRQLLSRNIALINMEADKRTALDFAVEHGHEEIVSMLVESAKETDYEDEGLEYANQMFHNAVSSGYDHIVSQFLAHNPLLIGVPAPSGKVDLQLAAENKRHTIVHYLLAQRAWPEFTEVGGTYESNLLQFAAEYGYDTVVARLLVEHPHMIDETVTIFGATALHSAAGGGHEKVVAQLLAARPSLATEMDLHGQIPLHKAAVHGHVKVVVQLLAHNPELIGAKNVHGDTALSLAATARPYDAVVYLITQGAAVDRDTFWYAVYDAEGPRGDEVVMLMLDRTPELARSLDDLDDRHNTLLHRVFDFRIKSKDLYSEALMLKCWQMDPEALHTKNLTNDTPFHLAIRSDNEFALELVQGKFSLGAILRAFAKCARRCPQSILDQLGECLLHSLNKDVVKLVYDYALGAEEDRPDNKRKRTHDAFSDPWSDSNASEWEGAEGDAGDEGEYAEEEDEGEYAEEENEGEYAEEENEASDVEEENYGEGVGK